MIWQFNLIILLLIMISAIAALQMKDVLSAGVLLGAYSFLMCLLWAQMGAVDVAFTEAAVGAGVSTVYVLATIRRTTRRTKD